MHLIFIRGAKCVSGKWLVMQQLMHTKELLHCLIVQMRGSYRHAKTLALKKNSIQQMFDLHSILGSLLFLLLDVLKAALVYKTN